MPNRMMSDISWFPPPEDDYDDRPVIEVVPGELHEAIGIAAKLLIASGGIYRRNGKLFRPDPSRKRLVLLRRGYLQLQLADLARWHRYDGRNQKFIPIWPPREITAAILNGSMPFPVPT